MFSAGLARPAQAQLLDSYYTPVGPSVGGIPSDISRDQALSEFDTRGVRVGDFNIRPDVASSFGYNSNVNGYPGGKGSAVVNNSATISAGSDWSRNSLFVSGTVNDNRYLSLANQSFTNWTINAGGTVDVGNDRIGLNLSHQNLNLIPGSIGNTTVLTPAAFRVDNATLNYSIATGGRLTFVPELSVTNYNYDSFTAGGVTVSESYQNRIATQAALTTRYEIAPERAAVLVLRGTNLTYQTGGGFGIPKRNSNGGTVLGGLDYQVPGSIFRFRALAGYQFRDFQYSAYSNLGAPVVEASIIYTPTRLTTLTLTALRDIEDASSNTISSYTLTSVRASVDHELRRNILLNGFVEFLQADYQNSSFNTNVVGVNSFTVPLITTNGTTLTPAAAGTTQSIYSVGGSATWLLNRNIRASGSFEASQHTGGGTSSFTSYTGLLTLGFRL